MLVGKSLSCLHRRVLAFFMGSFVAVGALSILSKTLEAAGRHSQAVRRNQDVATTRMGAVDLDHSKPIERTLPPGEVHSYRFTLTSGQFFQATVDQKGIDVVVTIVGPDGRKVAHVDRPSGLLGPETISVIAESDGGFFLEICPLSKAATEGLYKVSTRQLRPATPLDKTRILAESVITEAEELRAMGSAESFSRAMEKFEESLALWRSLGERYEEALALYGLGLSHSATGEYHQAVSCLRRALLLMKESGHLYGQATVKTGLAFAYLYLGENSEALTHFSEARLLRRSLKDLRGEAIAIYGIGWAHALLGDPHTALNCFVESLSLRRTVRDRRGEALVLTGLGKMYGVLGKRAEALGHLERSLEILRDLGDRYGEANTLSNIGWVYSSMGLNEKARVYFNLALPLRRLAGDRAGEATTLYGLAQVEMRDNNLLTARDHIQASVSIIESLRTRAANQQLRMSYFASVQEYYEFYTDLLMSLHKEFPWQGYASSALGVSERSRARVLLDMLTEIRADIRHGVEEELIEAERTLQRELNVAAERQRQFLSSRHRAEQASELGKQVSELARRYQDVLAQIREKSPQYAALIRPEPISAEEIQSLVDNDTLLLEYALGEQRSYVWAVSPTAVVCKELAPRADIEAAARRVYEFLTARNNRIPGETAQQRRARVAVADAEFLRAAAILSSMLLAPVAGHLQEKRLALATPGTLQYVPFAALPVPEPADQGETTGSGWSRYRPLIADHEIVQIPSASTIALLRRTLGSRPAPPKTIAVLADPVFSPEDGRVRSVNSGVDQLKVQRKGSANDGSKMIADTFEINSSGNQLIERLPRLFATRWEAEEIRSLVPDGQGLFAIDFLANRTTATSGELGKYRIVHFATHAMINNAHPDLSGVVLSLVDEAGKAQDGFLRAHDIFNLKLQADLVVLSACKTGLGKYVEGEGLLGLTRAFMYAGAPRIVVSLWSLNDKATAELMVSFYRGMLGPAKESPSAALRAAQLETLKEKPGLSPYFWAGFVLHGEWR